MDAGVGLNGVVLFTNRYEKSAHIFHRSSLTATRLLVDASILRPLPVRPYSHGHATMFVCCRQLLRCTHSDHCHFEGIDAQLYTCYQDGFFSCAIRRISFKRHVAVGQQALVYFARLGGFQPQARSVSDFNAVFPKRICLQR